MAAPTHKRPTVQATLWRVERPKGRSFGQNSAWNIIVIIFHARAHPCDGQPRRASRPALSSACWSSDRCPGAGLGGPVLPGGMVTVPLSGHARLWSGSVVGLGLVLVTSHRGTAPVRPQLTGAGRAWPRQAAHIHTAHDMRPALRAGAARWCQTQPSIARFVRVSCPGYRVCGQDLTIR